MADGMSRHELDALHDQVARRLAAVGQRYTGGRKRLVELLAASPQPIDVRVIVREIEDLPISSAYRSLSVFAGLGIVRRIAGDGDSGHFELDEELAGSHHHHGVCRGCGAVVDIDSLPRLERALTEAARLAGEQVDFTFDAHRIELVGLCARCRD